MVRVSHHPNPHSLASFVLEFGRHLVPHHRNLIAHQNVIGFKRLPKLEQRFQLGMKLYPLLL
jgi:heterodisulfide reductase subunit C